MRTIRVRKIAKAEISSAFDWYYRQSARAAARFLVAVDEAVKAVEEGPERHPVVLGRLRRVRMRGFPYAVYFKVYPPTISIVGVIHGNRHPKEWLRRAGR